MADTAADTAVRRPGALADAGAPAAAPSVAGRDRAVFLFDGDCAFCTSCADVVERRIPTTAEVTPWQFADLGALGVPQPDAEAAVVWVDPDGTTAAGPDAVARLLVDAGSYWRPLGKVLGLRLVRRCAWPAYRWLARNRHRMPGGTPACSVPQAQRAGRAGPTGHRGTT
jgi:predicted DCC family thiol-disulfide oxidoreductase YuxK